MMGWEIENKLSPNMKWRYRSNYSNAETICKREILELWSACKCDHDNESLNLTLISFAKLSSQAGLELWSAACKCDHDGESAKFNLERKQQRSSTLIRGVERLLRNMFIFYLFRDLFSSRFFTKTWSPCSRNVTPPKKKKARLNTCIAVGRSGGVRHGQTNKQTNKQTKKETNKQNKNSPV